MTTTQVRFLDILQGKGLEVAQALGVPTEECYTGRADRRPLEIRLHISGLDTPLYPGYVWGKTTNGESLVILNDYTVIRRKYVEMTPFDELVGDADRMKTLIEESGQHVSGGKGIPPYCKYWYESRAFVAEWIVHSGSLLDIGCGSGLMLKSLQQWGHRDIIPYGIDVNAKSINRARELFPECPDHFAVADVKDFLRSDKHKLPREYDYIVWCWWDDWTLEDTYEVEGLVTVYTDNDEVYTEGIGGRISLTPEQLVGAQKVMNLFESDSRSIKLVRSAEKQVTALKDALRLLRPDGWLVLAFYGNNQEAYERIEVLKQKGFTINQTFENPHGPGVAAVLGGYIF